MDKRRRPGMKSKKQKGHPMNRQPFNKFQNNLDKVNYYSVQMKRVFAALYSQPKTMLMVSIETGIRRSNITRFVAEWKRQNSVKIVRKGICPISKRGGVQYLTTNPDFFPAIVSPSKPKGNE
jgi:hypothetical protein